MAIGTGAALLIGSAIAGGATAFGAHRAASAAEDAAETQAESADEALALQERMYEQDRADTAPYRASGQGSIGMLSYQLGVPGFEGGPMSQMAPESAPDAQATTLSNLATPAAMPGNPRGMPRVPGSMQANYAQAGGPPVMAGNHPASILMEAPDGERGPVPANEMDRLTSLGFRRIQ